MIKAANVAYNGFLAPKRLFLDREENGVLGRGNRQVKERRDNQAPQKHYGFADEELDFIINYDIKYRMGRGVDGGGAQ